MELYYTLTVIYSVNIHYAAALILIFAVCLKVTAIINYLDIELLPLPF